MSKQGENPTDDEDEEYGYPEIDHDDDEDEGDDEEDGDEHDGSSAGPMVKPAEIEWFVPSVLHYFSKTHEVERYYVSCGKGKPEWTANPSEARVFTDVDHLKLAGRHARNYLYRHLKISPT